MSEVERVLAGRYHLLRLIGQGGMADVYLAEDQILKRTVAVKILRSSLTGDPIYITRFHREASAAAALSHPNIVAIYDVGEEDELYYIVMEYVRGQTLKNLIYKRGALHHVEAIDIMKQVVAGTADAHHHGIIHRDLKPQNILVTDSGTVKIADFGIASISSLSQVTETDTVMGSLHYLAPEIARGEKATAQSDIYALGIVFYELLRGEVPFNGESPVNIALKHMRDEIPSVREFNPSIPQSVENIIIKATAKNVKDRYASADDMLEDLETCLSRPDEPKLTFDAPVDEPTIIAGETQFFKKPELEEEEEEKTAEIEPKETRTTRVTRLNEQKAKKQISRKKKIILASVIALLAIVAGVILYFNSNQSLTMPNVVGMKKAEAIALLKDKGYKIDSDIEEELSDDYAKGYVIETDPAANKKIKKGSTIRLTVSSGKYLVMKDYTGTKLSQARKELEKQGFTVKTYYQTDEEFSKDVVIDQSISKGEKIDPNEEDKTITLTVSKGVIITVPNLRGENIESAKKTLQKLGFKVNLSILAEPTDPNVINTMSINTVVSQSIEPYTQVNKKGVDITLSYYDHKPEITNQTTNNNNNNTNNNTTTTPSNNNNTNSGTTNGTTGNNQSGNTSGSSNGAANSGGETQQDTSGKTTN